MPSSSRHESTRTIAPAATGGAFPQKQGMYNPAFEKDACGLAMVATLRGEAGHDIVDLALTALRNLEHRGAIGSDAGTGDGAGILTQIPDRFLRSVLAEDHGITLPPVGGYAVGVAFLPADSVAAEKAEAAIEAIEDAVMPLHRRLPAGGELLVQGGEEVAALAALAGTVLDGAAIESLFERAAAVAQGRPRAADPVLAGAQELAEVRR